MATRWSPDTCECVIDVVDWTTPSSPTNTIISRCAEHAALSTTALHTAVHNENRFTVSELRNMIEAAFPAFSAQLAAGTLSWNKFKKSLPRMTAEDAAALATLRTAHFCLYFDANRILHLIAPVLTAPQRTALQTQINTRFGVGRVVVG